MLYFAGRVDFAEGAAGGPPTVRAQLLKKGVFYYTKGGRNLKLDVDDEMIDTFYENFKKGVAGAGSELPMNMNHLDPNYTDSLGWFVIEKTADGLDAVIRPTDDMVPKLRNRNVKYISASIDFDNVDKRTMKLAPAIKGAAWTNLPYLQNMRGAELINFSDVEGVEDGDEDDYSLTKGAGGGIGHAKDPDATEADLPDQCRSCTLLMDDTCPFKGVGVKAAAAGDGTCPRYVSQESETDRPDSQRKQDQQMPANNPGQKTPQTDLSQVPGEGQVDLAQEVAELRAQNALLLDNATRDRATVVELAQTARKAKDQVLVRTFSEQGLSPHQIKLAEKLILKGRGMSGTVDLCDLNGGESVDLDQLDFDATFKEFVDSLEPQVNLSETKEAKNRPETGGTVDLSGLAQKRSVELSQTLGGKPDDHYRTALQQVAKENNIK